MAFYRLEAKIISREKRGRSVVAASAYRSGSKIQDERCGRTRDYTRRKQGVVESVILSPKNAPAWADDPGKLWNAVEQFEKRKDAQLAREFILAIPPELNDKQQFETAVGWAQSQLVSKGMVVEISLHHTKSGNNPHLHLLCTMRTMEGDAFCAKKPREWNDVALLKDWRKSWADAVNAALESAGRPERVDHRSLKDRGIDRIPEPKIGVDAAAMKRRGVVEDPERFKQVRKVKLLNEAMPFIRAIQRNGLVQHYGMAAGWWDKTMFLASRVRNQASRAVKNIWQQLVDKRRDKEPEPER